MTKINSPIKTKRALLVSSVIFLISWLLLVYVANALVINEWLNREILMACLAAALLLAGLAYGYDISNLRKSFRLSEFQFASVVSLISATLGMFAFVALTFSI